MSLQRRRSLSAGNIPRPPSPTPPVLTSPTTKTQTSVRNLEMRHENQFASRDGVTTSVVLVVENRELFVSKEVLALTSPVFRSMFESDFREKGAHSIPLPGKTYHDMVEFLECLYPNIQKNITEDTVYAVLRIADEYQVDILRHKCIDFLRQRCMDPATSIQDLLLILHTAETYFLNEIFSSCFNRVMKAHPLDLSELHEFQHISVEARNDITCKRSQALQNVKVTDDNVYDVLKDASEFNEEELVQKCEQHLITRCKRTDKPLIHGLVTMLCAADTNKLSRLRDTAIELAIKRRSYDLEASPIFTNVNPETRCRILSKRLKVFETLFGKLCKLRNHCCRKHTDYNCKICFISVTKESYAMVGMCF